ncbi:hypothetical protein BDP27DRAFT_1363081 [Rhodocollybia butyracea]|uniref:Uncharacterized protein n=1 Tax=Rhodocollybia butyracea TaxID=206335 RepID=A0A9P5PTH3_9AGAR|nr:hypothetical protein BDP27DRAFT_1363081 [Rhodocollybia butyracea]
MDVINVNRLADPSLQATVETFGEGFSQIQEEGNLETYPDSDEWKTLDGESFGYISDDMSTNHRPLDSEEWSAFGDNTMHRRFYLEKFDSMIQAELPGSSPTSLQNGNETTMRGTDSNQRYHMASDPMSIMSSTTNNTRSPVFRYNFPNDGDSLSCPTLAQDLNVTVPPPLLESSVLPHRNSNGQSPHSTYKVSQSSPPGGGAREPPGISTNAFVLSPVHSLDFFRNSYQNLEDSILPQPLLDVDEGRHIVGVQPYSMVCIPPNETR